MKSLPKTIVKTDTETDLKGAERSKQWSQYVAVFAATIASFAVGTNFAWPSPSVPKIMSDEFPLNITSDEGSYITIIGPIGNIIGAPLTAFLSDAIGRKYTVLAMALPQLVSWTMIAFAHNTYLFCLARFVAGLTEGALFIVVPMYIGEVSEPKIRGVLGSSISVSFISGILFINCVAPYYSIATTAFICLCFPVLLVFVFVWMPETPYYLIMKGNIEEARKSLQFLRRMNNVDAELTKLTSDVERQISEPGSIKDLFRIASNRKALFILFGLRTAQQFSGVSAFGLYTHTIFNQAGGDISANLSVIIYTSAQILMTFGGSFFIDMFGRKPVLLISCIGSTLILAVEGLYFYFKDMTDYDTSVISWLPLAGMLAYVCLFSIGLGTVPNLMLGELFSASVKGKALFLLNIYYAVLISTISKLFQAMADNFGMYVPFTIFASTCVLGTIFSHFCVPETKGKTLEEIQQHLKGNVKDKDVNSNV
ncbi:nebulosa [Carabus blaptoides fortunei]